MPLEFQRMLCSISNKTYKLLHYMLISTTSDTVVVCSDRSLAIDDGTVLSCKIVADAIFADLG